MHGSRHGQLPAQADAAGLDPVDHRPLRRPSPAPAWRRCRDRGAHDGEQLAGRRLVKELGTVGTWHYAGLCKLPLCRLILLVDTVCTISLLCRCTTTCTADCAASGHAICYACCLLLPLQAFVKCTTPSPMYNMRCCAVPVAVNVRVDCQKAPTDLPGCVGSPQFAAPRNSTTNRLVSETICAHNPSNPKRPSYHALASCMGLHGGTRVTFMRILGSDPDRPNLTPK